MTDLPDHHDRAYRSHRFPSWIALAPLSAVAWAAVAWWAL